MDKITEFHKAYLEKHPLFYVSERKAKGGEDHRKVRNAKYGHKGDPNYYRNRYALSADYREYMKDYHNKRCEDDPNYLENYRKYCRNHNRHNVLGTYVNGKYTRVKVKKRQWPGRCELCNRENRKLFYHHWDDGNMSLGLWLCLRCHMFAENADIEGTVDRYIELKRKVTASLASP